MKNLQNPIQNITGSTGRTAGFSIVELITTVLVVSILATISVVAVGKITQSSQRSKVLSDVNTLNSAIKIYQASGGDLSGSMTVDQVLNKLKTSRSRAMKKRHVGAPSGRMIDVRTVAVPVAADSWKARARYDSASKRFVAINSGPGVEFTYDESLNESFFGVENRDNGAVSYAANSPWVWDHAATNNPNGPQGPSVVPVSEPPVDANPDPPVVEPPVVVQPPIVPGGNGNGGGEGGDPPPAPIPYLPFPQFSLASGGYPDTQFPLSVTITNVPDSEDGSAIVKIGNGNWGAYAGSISIPTEPTVILAQFVTADPEDFQDSYVRSASYYPIASSINGTSSATFNSPSGGQNMVYQITQGGKKFVHGNNEYDPGGGAAPIPVGEKNSLQVTQANFNGVAPGTEFKLLNFTYHNGNSFYDSHATAVKLNMNLNFPSLGQSMNFDIDLNLVNTQNDPSDPNASADYVTLSTTSQNLGLTINGVSYRLSYRFHSVDSSGFNTNSQFHVYEGNTGQAEIRATLIANP